MCCNSVTAPSNRGLPSIWANWSSRRSAQSASILSKRSHRKDDHMEKPDQRLFEEDLSSAEFRTGVVKEFWDLAGADLLPEGLAWPARVFWMAAAVRANAPVRFYV